MSTGKSFIRNYSFEQLNISSQCWNIDQDQFGVVYAGNTEGLIVKRDNWQIFKMPNHSIVRSLAINSNNEVFVGAQNEFGVFRPDQQGRLKYYSFSKKLDSAIVCKDDVWKIYNRRDTTYFCSFSYIYIYKNDILQKAIPLDPLSSFFTFYVDDQVIVSDYKKGLLSLNGEELVSFPGGTSFQENSVVGIEQLSDDLFLVATISHGIFLLNTRKKEKTAFTSATYQVMLAQSQISDIEIVNDLIYVSTLTNGIYIFSPQGRAMNHVNQSKGLLDDRIYAIYADEKDNIWIAQDKGISLFETGIPFRRMNDANGLQGTVNAIKTFNGKTYIGSSEGLYEINEESIIPVTKIRHEIWDLELFNNHLLIGSNSGFYFLEENGNVANVEDQINSLRGKRLTVYEVSTNDQQIIVGTNKGIHFFTFGVGQWKKKSTVNLDTEVRKIVTDQNEDIWAGSFLSGVYRIVKNEDIVHINHYGKEEGFSSLDNIQLTYFDGYIIAGTEKGFMVYNPKYDKFFQLPADHGLYFNNSVSLLEMDEGGNLWVEYDSVGRNYLKKISHEHETFISYYKPWHYLTGKTLYSIGHFNQTTSFGFQGEIVFYDNQLINREVYENDYVLIDEIAIAPDSVVFHGYIDSFLSEEGNYKIPVHHLQLDYKYNDVMFRVSSPFHMKGDVIEYNFFLEGAMDEWSGWTTDKKYTANNLREGKYVFHVKSKNVFGVESRPVIYEFQVKPPWYRTIWAWAAYVIVFLTILYLFVKWYTHRLRMEKLRLEKIVADRTAEINSQKEKIEVQNREITDSIHYAQRIQDAVLPADAKISQLLSEYFIFFKPRDIVSGDFFWISERKNKIIIAAADCTGHGVPGAFMSMLGVSFLNEIITHSKLDSASELLNILRERVKNTLGQEGKENEAKDGMDMALCIIDYEAMTLQYAGAYNPLYFFKDGEFNQVKADKCPIGIHAKEIPSFTNHIIPLQKGDTFYIFSDGFQDQFGGPKGRKFMSVPFKRLLSGIHEKPLKEQERIIQATYDDWRGDHEQVDDILIIGFRT